MDGWVMLHRRLLSWEWFDKAEMVQLFLYLLLSANHADKKWQGVDVRRGQLLTSNAKIAKHTRLSAQTIRTCINRLKSTGEITTETTNQYSLITICNYDRYQCESQVDNEQIDERSNKRLTNDQQTTNKHNNNYNNYNNYNNISIGGARERTREEREKIFELFFFKNFLNPGAEVDKFYDNYEAQGWKRANGQKIIDVAAVAKGWSQGGSLTGQRFTSEVLAAIKSVYDNIGERSKAISLLRGIYGAKLNSEHLLITCSKEAHGLIKEYGVDILQQAFKVPILGQIINQS